MSQNDSSKNVSVNNNLDKESNINHCKEIFLMIDEHKKKLEELKNNNNSNNKLENQKFSFNKKENKPNLNLKINQMDIDNSINLAKYFLQKNKEKTIKIFNNIDNKITPYLGLHFNYDDNDNNNDNQENICNNTNYNNTNYNNKTYYNFLKQNATEPNTTKNKNKSINKISLLHNNSNKIIRSNSRVYTTSNNLYDNSINKDLDKSKKNKTLKDKLKRREERIKKLESNIASLNKENQSLKQYIIELQHNLLTYNNKKINNAFNKNLFNDSESMKSSMEDLSLINKFEKIMNSINIFIKKMYNLFPNLGCTGDFKDLNYHQPKEVEKKFDKIWNMIHNFFTLKKNVYNSNESSIVDMISTIEYDKNGMKKPKYKNLIKKLENKSSKKAIKKKNKIAYEFNSSGCPVYKNKIKIKSNNY